MAGIYVFFSVECILKAHLSRKNGARKKAHDCDDVTEPEKMVRVLTHVVSRNSLPVAYCVMLYSWTRPYYVQQNEYYLRRLSSPRHYRCPACIDRGCKSFQALAAILDYVTHLASMSCRYRSDAKQDEFRRRLSQAAISWISKVRGYEHVCSRWSAKKTKQKKTRKYQL